MPLSANRDGQITAGIGASAYVDGHVVYFTAHSGVGSSLQGSVELLTPFLVDQQQVVCVQIQVESYVFQAVVADVSPHYGGIAPRVAHNEVVEVYAFVYEAYCIVKKVGYASDIYLQRSVVYNGFARQFRLRCGAGDVQRAPQLSFKARRKRAHQGCYQP